MTKCTCAFPCGGTECGPYSTKSRMADLDKELELRTTKRLQLYGDFLNKDLDDDMGGGLEDYTDGIKLDGVRLVNESWLLNLVERQKKLEVQLVDAVDRINDLLKRDDGQAYKEAERFMERYYKESHHD